MADVGARAKHRAPTRYRPANELLGWMCLLAPVLGILVAAAREATQAGDTGWAWFFWCFTAVDVVMYFLVVRLWIKWLP